MAATLRYMQPHHFQVPRTTPVKFTNISPQNLIKPYYVYQNTSGAGHQFQCSDLPNPSGGSCELSKKKVDNFCNIKGSLCACSSCGKVYENSGDSLSDFDLSTDCIGVGGHMCPNSPSVRQFHDPECR